MGRYLKAMEQLVHLFATFPDGWPGCQETKVRPLEEVDLFKVEQCGTASMVPSPAPPFLVPAIMDALRSSTDHCTLVHLVPGEADAFCARHVATNGGIVLTSDSDLLVHELGNGRVALLREIFLNFASALMWTTFSPASISQSLRLDTEDICRFAYERQSSPHASALQLVNNTRSPVKDSQAYQEFRGQYDNHETGQWPVTVQGQSVRHHHLDPRLSELILQFNASQQEDTKLKMFLPNLIDNPARGTAWENSTPIRQLAYTIAGWLIPVAASSVQEYRRVQDTQQKGREVSISSMQSVQITIEELVSLLSRAEELTQDQPELFWFISCLALDISECQKKQTSQTLKIFQTATRSDRCSTDGGTVPWDVIHFVALLQSGHYSFRILHQILNLSVGLELDTFSPNLSIIQAALSNLPPLTRYPDIYSTLDFLTAAKTRGVLGMLRKLVHLPPEVQDSLKLEETEMSRRGKHKKRRQGSNKEKSTSTGLTANRFSLLPID